MLDELIISFNLCWKLMKKIKIKNCLLYTSDAADERSSVDLGGRRIIKKKNTHVDLDITLI